MAESKPLASLSAGLLARKGSARPAMRRQTAPGVGTGFNGHGHDDLGWNDMGYDVNPHHVAAEPTRPASHGLSPMLGSTESIADDVDAIAVLAEAVERAMPEPVPVQTASVEPIVADAPLPQASEPPLVVRQRAMIAAAVEDMDVPAPPRAAPRSVRTPVPRAQAGMRGNYAFTLRLDPDRHLRLRLASATSNRSAQQILIALVDEFLSTQPEIDAFAARLPANARC